MKRRTGFSIIEVLVALALLAIIGAAIIASFSLTTRLNRDASIDVDYSRVVRSVMERVKVVWSDPNRWGSPATEAEDINVYMQRFGSDCEAEVILAVDAAAVGDDVRVLELRCGVGGAGTPAQVFQMEFGSP